MSRKISAVEWVKRLHRHLDHVIANREPDLTGITIPELMRLKFRQSLKRHGSNAEAVCLDCKISRATYYRYLHILNLRHRDDCDNNHIAKLSIAGRVSLE